MKSDRNENISKLIHVDTDVSKKQAERKRVEYRLGKDGRSEFVETAKGMVRRFQGPREEFREIVREIDETLEDGSVQTYTPDHQTGEQRVEVKHIDTLGNPERAEVMTEAYFESLERKQLEKKGDKHLYDPKNNLHIAYDVKKQEEGATINLALYGDSFSVQDYAEDFESWTENLM